MTTFLWKKQSFYNDLKSELTKATPYLINITSAYISYNGAQLLQKLVAPLQLESEDIQIYCSVKFDEQQPVKTLKLLSSFATVYILEESFLHSKVYEIHQDTGVITYTGSANLTEGGFTTNSEMMCKTLADVWPLEDYWDYLCEHSVLVTDEVLELYSELPSALPTPVIDQFYDKVKKKLPILLEQRQIEANYPDLSGYFFTVDDYSVFDERYWQSGLSGIKLRRTATQEKFYELNEAIESFAQKLDLYPHYLKANLTSGIVPSVYNFERVTGIWMRYGKHKSELNLFEGLSQLKQKSAIEQFHKHACLQLSIGSEGLEMGMFHSTANDGVDSSYVYDHWTTVKAAISQIYTQIQGHGFIWRFYSNKLNEGIDEMEIDDHTAEQFLTFYKKYYMDGYESMCMRFYLPDDERIKTYKQIVHELQETFKAILPLYNAMTYRIPVKQRTY